MSDYTPCRAKPIFKMFKEFDSACMIETREGPVFAFPHKHYIMRGVEGEPYIIEKDLFHKSYDIININDLSEDELKSLDQWVESVGGSIEEVPSCSEKATENEGS